MINLVFDRLALIITWLDIFAAIKLIFFSLCVYIWSYSEENDTTCDTHLSQANCAFEWITFFLRGLFVAIVREIHSNKLFFGCNTLQHFFFADFFYKRVFQHKLNTLIWWLDEFSINEACRVIIMACSTLNIVTISYLY